MIIPKKHAGNFSLPELGLGTWQMGGGYEPDTSRDSAEVAFIKQAFEMGVRHFDTAEVYGGGHAEELLGRSLKTLPREEIVLTSKVSDEHLAYEQVVAACRASLKRLQTPYLDLYLIHAPSSAGVPVGETFSALNDLKKDKFIRHIGVSNFDIKRLQEAVEVSKSPIATNQIHFSVGARGNLEDGMLDFCRKNGILVTAYRPVALGLLREKRGNLGEQGWSMLADIGDKYGKTAVQVALAWVLNQSGVVALVRTANSAHLQEDLGAVGFKLDERDVRFLDNNFPKIPTIYPIPSRRA